MSRRVHVFIPVTYLLLGIAIAFFPTFVSGFQEIQGDLGDTRFNNYILEHSFLWITGSPLHHSLWQLPIFHPTKNTGAFSDLLLSVAPLYWFFRLGGIPSDTSFQLWLITSQVLNFLAMLLVLGRGMRFGLLPSTLGAYFFTFASIRLVQFGHPQLVPQFFMIFALHSLLMSFRKQEEGKKKASSFWLFSFALASILQLYASVYHGWLYVFSLGMVSLISVCFHDTRSAIHTFIQGQWKSILLGAGVAALLISPMAMAYYSAAKQVGYHDFGGVHIFLPPIWGWFFMGDRNVLYGWLSELPTFAGIGLRDEKSLGWGLVGTLWVLWGLFCWKRRSLKRVSILYLLCCVLILTNLSSFGSLWQYLYLYFPSAGAIRAPGRIALIMLIPASIAIAVGAKHLQKLKWGSPALVFLSLFLAAEQIQIPWTFNKQNTRKTYQNIAESLENSKSCDSFILTQQKGRAGFFKYHLDAMWAANLVHIPTLNGYSGKSPEDWPFMDVNFHSEEEQRHFRTKLAAWVNQHGLDPDRVCWVFRNVWKPKEMYTRSVAKALKRLPELTKTN